jgi:hypothetical protein
MIAGFQLPPIANSGNVLGDVAPWLGIMVILIIVGGVIAMNVRRKMNGGDDSSGIGFTLSDLRAMHERGELTLEEFQRARDKMLGSVRGRESSSPAGSESRISRRVPPRRKPGTGPDSHPEG